MVKRKDKYKPESIRKISQRAINRARQTECVSPHELLRYWANGIEIAGVLPDPDMQVQCAIACAPYYASKLQAIEVKQETTIRSVISASPVTVAEWASRYAIDKAEALPSLPVPPSMAAIATDNIVSPSSLEVDEDAGDDDML